MEEGEEAADALGVSAKTVKRDWQFARVWLEQQLQERALQGELMVYEWLFINAQQEEIPCEIRLNRFPSATSQLVRGSVTDITARKQAELKMQRSREMLRIQNERLIELAASHELNSGDLDIAFEYISKTLIDLLKVTRA